MNKSFCAFPWMGLSTHPNGDLKPCIIRNTKVLKKDGTPYNLGYDSIEDVWNSEYYRDMRRKMYNGEYITECSECYIQEESGMISQRANTNRDFLGADSSVLPDNLKVNLYNTTTVQVGDANFLRKIIDSAANDFYVENDIEYIDLRFSNKCNLKCTMCNPDYSTRYDSEVKTIAKTDERILKYLKPTDTDFFSWYTTNQYRENIKNHLPSIKQLILAGGEPFLIPENLEILQKLLDMGKQDVVVLIISNMTGISNEFLSVLSKFDTVIICASLDAHGTVQEYIRYPSKWEQVEKNVHKILELPNLFILFNPVVHSINLEYMVDFYKFLETLPNNRFELWNVCLVYPQQMEFKYLPLEYKKECWAKYEEWYNNTTIYKNETLQGVMNRIKTLCNTDYYDVERLKELKEFNDMLDTSRNVRLKSVNPKLHEILEKL